MRHRATSRFWKHFQRLPQEVKQLADENYKQLCTDQRHPSLQLKKVGDYWSVRVGLHYRALVIEDGADLVRVWIGTHAEYDHLIRG